VECGQAGQLHKMFAAPIFPLLVPLAWVSCSENQLYRAPSQASLPETLCNPASQRAERLGHGGKPPPLKTGVLNY